MRSHFAALFGIMLALSFLADLDARARHPECPCKKQAQTTSVSATCVITIDGKPAKLEDIKGLDAIITIEVTKIAATSKKR